MQYHNTIGGLFMNVQDYMSLPYSIIIRHKNGTHYCASVFELDGCSCDGKTYEEAYENIQEAMAEWIEEQLENDLEVPLPLEDNLPMEDELPLDNEKFSGRFVLRLPKSLHARLAREA
jgi:predicted RNase H-like HicB family nuclease